MTKIKHLTGITSCFVETHRLKMHLLTAGDPDNTPIIFLHGNTSSSTFWEEFMLRFSDEFYCVAPDLRGFGETEKDKIIDATRGALDWVDDIEALTSRLNFTSFHLTGHSLGGFAGWSIMAEMPERLGLVTLFAPGPPMGFGGLKGKEGKPNNEDFAGSGAGIVNKELVNHVLAQDRSSDDPLYSPRNVMNRLFWKEGFMAEREDDFLEVMLSVHTGKKCWPGDFIESDYWPGVAPGKYGPANALSPKYNQQILAELVQLDKKPSVLWIRGEDDKIVSDASYSDPGFQGMMDLRDGWPGKKLFPPQPMNTQIKYALDEYKAAGGTVYRKLMTDCGHSPFIEKPEEAAAEMKQHLLNH